MLFERTYSLKTNRNMADLQNLLLSKKIKIDQYEYEIFKENNNIHILPNRAVLDGKFLPEVILKLDATIFNGTNIEIKATLREQDKGGPILVLIFCALLFIASLLFFLISAKEFEVLYLTTLGLGLLIFGFFWLRMQRGYFKHIRTLKSILQKNN
jgi:hypothetical protein